MLLALACSRQNYGRARLLPSQKRLKLGSPKDSPSQTPKRRMNSALRKIRHQPLAKASGMVLVYGIAKKQFMLRVLTHS
jgi:hypothetical protein